MREFYQYYFRNFTILIILICIIFIAYQLWEPGKYNRTGRHDLRKNGIWMQHGWLGDNTWFQENRREKGQFRNDQKISELANLLSSHGIKYVFPHLCPCDLSGKIANEDPDQTKKFLYHFKNFSVMPWVGGILGKHCFPESPEWRASFVSSVVMLLKAYPRLAGIHVNIEPMPSGNKSFIILLEELKKAMPGEKILSVAAFPPPTLLHPFPEVHWNASYYKQISQHADQIVPMMYDTAIRASKIYQYIMAGWTIKILNWSENSDVLFGLPVYDDTGVGYHYPNVENLKTALLGIHAGLSKLKPLPLNYAGVAIYCEWETDQTEWDYFKKEFEKSH